MEKDITRLADRFKPELTEEQSVAVELLERLRESEILDYMDYGDVASVKADTANRIMNGITAHYNNLIKGVLSGKIDVDKILNKLSHEDRQKY